MKYIVAATSILAVGLLLLWRQVRTPSGEVAPIVRPMLEPAASHARPAAVRDAPVHAEAPVVLQPLGGVRAWSPAAAPTDGPDPYAPVPQVRTAEDTRAGLAE